jgi:hypothetical protein
LPRNDGASGKYKMTRKKRKRLGDGGSPDASKRKSRSAKIKRSNI